MYEELDYDFCLSTVLAYDCMEVFQGTNFEATKESMTSAEGGPFLLGNFEMASGGQ